MNFSTISRITKAALQVTLAVATASLIPSSAWACSGCMVGDPKTAAVYFGMTVIMSGLPLLLIGGVGYWLYRHHS